MTEQITTLRYVVWKQTPCTFPDGTKGYTEPYVYAMTSNSRSAIHLCEYAARENPRCRVWKMNILSNGMIPDPERVSIKGRSYFTSRIDWDIEDNDAYVDEQIQRLQGHE